MQRRDFLKAGAVASAAVAMPNIVKAASADQKIRMGFIGIGNRGTEVMRQFMNQPDVEVVALPNTPQTVLLAVEEMTNGLNGVFGGTVPFVTAPTPGKKHIFLGSNTWTVAAGIDTTALKRDAFRLIAKGDDVFIAGRDDPRRRLLREIARGWDADCEKATVHGVYEFLERYAGVRFYFPGPLGTILPKAKALKVPEGDFTCAPDYTTRKYSWYPDGVYFEGTNRTAQLLPERKHISKRFRRVLQEPGQPFRLLRPVISVAGGRVLAPDKSERGVRRRTKAFPFLFECGGALLLDAVPVGREPGDVPEGAVREMFRRERAHLRVVADDGGDAVRHERSGQVHDGDAHPADAVDVGDERWGVLHRHKHTVPVPALRPVRQLVFEHEVPFRGLRIPRDAADARL